jgi:hypothetical protein
MESRREELGDAVQSFRSSYCEEIACSEDEALRLSIIHVKN